MNSSTCFWVAQEIVPDLLCKLLKPCSSPGSYFHRVSLDFDPLFCLKDLDPFYSCNQNGNPMTKGCIKQFGKVKETQFAQLSLACIKGRSRKDCHRYCIASHFQHDLFFSKFGDTCLPNLALYQNLKV